MRTRPWTLPARGIVALATFVAAVALLLPGFAEVSVDGPSGEGQGFLFAALEGGSGGVQGVPFPWGCVRQHVPGEWLLNPGGDDEGDGQPAFSISPADGRPTVTWAEALTGGGTRIVLSRWDGSGWTEPEPVTGDGVEVADPALDHREDGSLVVAWWEPGSGSLAWVRERGTERGWQDPERIGPSDRPCRFPVVAAGGGETFVGFTAGLEDGRHEVRVARETAGWADVVLDVVDYRHWRGEGDVGLELHEVGGVTWADWLRAADRLATSRWDPAAGEWTEPEEIPCAPTADGWRAARFEAKARALGWRR